MDLDISKILEQFNRKADIKEIINNSRVETLYKSEDSNGNKYLNVVYYEDEQAIQFSPRVLFQVVHNDNKNDLKSLKIYQYNYHSKEVKDITFSNFSFGQLRAFLRFLDEINIDSINERKISLSNGSNNEEIATQIKELLHKNDGEEILKQILSDESLVSKDIVNIGYRKKGLEQFRENLKNNLSEKKWQEFFKNNLWIFGYGLDYRFNSCLQDEASVSSSNLDGSNTVISDFLMGDNSFTTFVELKKPQSKIFSVSKNRSNSWCLTSEFFNAVSQILEQKASGQIKLEQSQNYTKNGNEIIQKAYDSKVILLYGSWQELESDNPRDKQIKKKTFELFRRNNRNIEIITYDELFERAEFIVEGNISYEG
ncbi:Shedu immune nuclease family protein [Francisella uliginis]|uniref:Shedu protein SduA C-terminal domain-containing protein n=1 Tax=Francisella uliginis TaxID=573570 RepID=A0A1L4BS42_9GAMM|nr:Shedu immune nuclease family protein [Francisella uliginis]API86666.1 hypothetical protein F7310_04520 [Francisella uliginis]